MRSFVHSRFLLFVLTTVPLPVALIASVAPSQIRIVRLSFAYGDVKITEPGSGDPTSASLDTPVRQGATITTGFGSYAEVEFENGSTARLGERSQLDFTQLALDPQGARLNTLHLVGGYGTFHFMPKRNDVNIVQALDTTLQPSGSAEFRADVFDEQLRVEVMSGSVNAVRSAEAQKQALGKNKVLALVWKVPESLHVTEGFTQDVWDKWVQARDQKALRKGGDASDDSPPAAPTYEFGLPTVYK